MKPLLTMGDQSRTFINLLGFESIEAWNEFSQDNREESILIGTHFNIGIKGAIDQCKKIIAWRKIDLSKYNQKKRKNPDPSDSTEIIKHPKLANFEWKTILEEKPSSPVSITSTVSTTKESSTQTDPPSLPSLPPPTILTATYLKEKKINEAIITSLNFQIMQIQAQSTDYKHELSLTQKKLQHLHGKFHETYLQLGRTLTDTSKIIKKTK